MGHTYMKCKTCELDLPESEFPVQRQVNSSRGSCVASLRPHCRPCVAEKARQWRKAHPGYSGSGKVTKYPPEVRKLVSLCAQRVQDAKARSVTVDVDTDYVYAMLLQQGNKCALSGIEMSHTKGDPHVLSLDQINPGLGYVVGNVQWLSWSVNRAKGDLTMEQFIAMCVAVLGRCNDYPEGEYTQVGGSAQHSTG